MHVPTFALMLLLALFLAEASPHSARSGSPIEALTQAGYRLSFILDTKNYTALESILTEDVVLDATDLRPSTPTDGFEETVAAFKRSGAEAKTFHQITNVLLLDQQTPEKARVNSYIAYSHWVEGALDDPTKTWRIYYRCDDIWVLRDAAWKLQYSKVYNMGYGSEAPYYGVEELFQGGAHAFGKAGRTDKAEPIIYLVQETTFVDMRMSQDKLFH